MISNTELAICTHFIHTYIPYGGSHITVYSLRKLGPQKVPSCLPRINETTSCCSRKALWQWAKLFLLYKRAQTNR